MISIFLSTVSRRISSVLIFLALWNRGKVPHLGSAKILSPCKKICNKLQLQKYKMTTGNKRSFKEVSKRVMSTSFVRRSNTMITYISCIIPPTPASSLLFFPPWIYPPSLRHSISKHTPPWPSSCPAITTSYPLILRQQVSPWLTWWGWEIIECTVEFFSIKKQKPTKNARTLRRNKSSLDKKNRTRPEAQPYLIDQK